MNVIGIDAWKSIKSFLIDLKSIFISDLTQNEKKLISYMQKSKDNLCIIANSMDGYSLILNGVENLDGKSWQIALHSLVNKEYVYHEIKNMYSLTEKGINFKSTWF